MNRLFNRPQKIALSLFIALSISGAALLLWPTSREDWDRYIQDNPGYFFDRPSFYAQRKAEHLLRQIPFLIRDWRFKRAWQNQIQANYVLQNSDTLDQVQSALKHLEGTLLSQNQVRHEPLQTSGLATLVRGFGYCDQINMSLALALQGKVPNVEVWALVDTQKNESPHTVVRLTGDFGILYADLWQPIHLFGFDEQVTPAFRSRVPLFSQVAPQLSTLFHQSNSAVQALYDNGYLLNRHDIGFQVKKLFERIWKGPLDLAPVPVDLPPPVAAQIPAAVGVGKKRSVPVPAQRLITPSERESVRKNFLKARLALLLDHNREPMKMVALQCLSWSEVFPECQAAQIFSR